jgi:type I restriction enzyme S subunit
MQSPSPSLRFPSFKESCKEQRLAKFFTSSRAKGKDGMPTLSVTLNRGLINRDEIDRKTETNLEADEHLLVRPDDIAYNMMRMWQGAFGRSNREGIVSPAYVVLRPLASADSGYFEYAFRRSRSIYLFWAYSYGLTNDRLRLYANDFLRIPFSAPTLPEQRKIADFLTAVDGRLAQLRQKKALLEAYKKGVMQQLFTQALRFKDDQGNEFPDWEEKTLGEICNCFSGGTPTSGKRDYYGGSIPFIRSAEIAAESTALFLTEKGLRESAAKMVEAGDLLVALYGANSGEVGISKITGAINQAILCVRTKQSVRFLYFWLEFSKQSIVNTYLQGGQGNLSGRIVQALNIAVPSVCEQTKIANFLTALDRKIETVAAQIAHTQTWKKGLLQQMFV